MPINVNYSPVSLLASLAQGAGQAEGQQQQFSQGMQALQFVQSENDRRQAAADRANELQQAHADMLATAQSRTPLADHVAEQADVARQNRMAQQTAYKSQLDDMLSSGTIDQTQYQKGLMAALTNNDTMMAQTMAAPRADKPNISNAEEVEIIRQPFREQRQQMQSTFNGTIRNIFNPEEIEKQKTALQSQLSDNFAKEAAAINQWRQNGNAKETPAEPTEINAPIMDAATAQGAMAGVARMIGMPGSAAQAGPVPMPVASAVPPAPAVGQRIVGELYRSPSGRIGRWTGSGWEVE